MTCPPRRRPAAPAAALAALALGAAPLALAAQEQPGSFQLPPPSPSPTPAPAGPADERAGVAIPPRAVRPPRIEPVPVLTPEPLPSPSPRPLPSAAPARPVAAPAPRPSASPAPIPTAAPAPDAGGEAAALPPASDPLAPPTAAPLPTAAPTAAPLPAPVPADDATAAEGPALPEWWPYAAGGLGALVLLGGALAARARRKPRAARLAAPVAGAGAEGAAPPPELPRLDLALEVTGATRSLMMFTLRYRLTIANRSERAVNQLAVALELACARASTANAPSPGAAQALADIARIGPHQARSIVGEVQLPLAAIRPLRQGATPLFVPLLHVSLEGEGQRTMTRSFVIGTPSASGRVHPIPLDRPPGGIEGLVAQAIAAPPLPAAA